VADGIEGWFNESAHQIESLLAVTNVAQNALISGTTAVRTSAGLIRSAANEGQRWLEAHPCPDQVLNRRFERLFARYGDLGDRFEREAKEQVVGYIEALAREVGILGGELADFIAAVQKRLHDMRPPDGAQQGPR
jgi:hypothetical protein